MLCFNITNLRTAFKYYEFFLIYSALFIIQLFKKYCLSNMQATMIIFINNYY